MTALVGTDRDGVRILLHRGSHHLGYAAVVSEVDDFPACVLNQSPDQVDRGIVTIE